MWLLPAFSAVSRLAARVYYRVRTTGAPVPSDGPALLVANHPNSLFDPVLVAAAARRPVRFLAKAPLFTDPRVGWLVRGSGAIPVYRRQDDPAAMGANEDSFRAVHDALAGGAAVGIFPEGTSHSEPGLVRLKTGAARIVLGAAEVRGVRATVVPVGLVLRAKGSFRSEALAVVGEPVPWHDLASRGEADADAVRDLTDRIEAALRAVTLNTERWEDQPLVECAEAIWSAAHDAGADEAHRIERLAVASRLLADARRHGEPEALALAARVERHAARLARLGLRADDLAGTTTARVRRAAWRGPLWLAPAVAVALVGWLAYLAPYRLTGPLAARLRPAPDQVSTYRLLVGIPLYAVWTLAIALVILALAGLWWGLAALLGLPLLGYLGLRVREGWRDAWDDARRLTLVRSRRSLLERLRRDQAELATDLSAFVRRERTTEPGNP